MPHKPHNIGVAAQIDVVGEEAVELKARGVEDIPAYAKVRSRILGDARPAFMLLVVPQLVCTDLLLEVESIAATAN